MNNLDMEQLYEIADRYDVKLVEITDGMSIKTQEEQVISYIQSNLMNKYDLTIKKRGGMFVVYFDECLD